MQTQKQCTVKYPMESTSATTLLDSTTVEVDFCELLEPKSEASTKDSSTQQQWQPRFPMVRHQSSTPSLVHSDRHWPSFSSIHWNGRELNCRHRHRRLHNHHENKGQKQEVVLRKHQMLPIDGKLWTRSMSNCALLPQVEPTFRGLMPSPNRRHRHRIMPPRIKNSPMPPLTLHGNSKMLLQIPPDARRRQPTA